MISWVALLGTETHPSEICLRKQAQLMHSGHCLHTRWHPPPPLSIPPYGGGGPSLGP